MKIYLTPDIICNEVYLKEQAKAKQNMLGQKLILSKDPAIVKFVK